MMMIKIGSASAMSTSGFLLALWLVVVLSAEQQVTGATVSALDQERRRLRQRQRPAAPRAEKQGAVKNRQTGTPTFHEETQDHDHSHAQGEEQKDAPSTTVTPSTPATGSFITMYLDNVNAYISFPEKSPEEEEEEEGPPTSRKAKEEHPEDHIKKDLIMIQWGLGL